MIVVAAALIVNGRVLAARRSAPEQVAGRWEFPGGKIEPGETPEQALARECSEELGVLVRIGEPLGSATDRIELRLYEAALVEGEPMPLEDHDELRWLDSTDLRSVAWLPIDAQLLDLVAPLLG